MRPQSPIGVSLILPCYKVSAYIARSIEESSHFLSSVASSWEIVAVDDGSPDATWETLEAIQANAPCVRILRHPQNRGKGGALKTGLLASRGKYCIFTDADIPYRLDDMSAMFLLLKDGAAPMVVGDRGLPGSEYHAKISLMRAFLSKMCSLIVGNLIVGGYYDTQCGLKGFQGVVGREIASRMRIDGFACDVEMIYIALKNRIDIGRIPVVLRRNELSSISALKTGVAFLTELASILRNRFCGRYRSDILSDFSAQECQRQLSDFAGKIEK